MTVARESVAELFCGAGGMSCGFDKYFHVAYAVDKARPAVETYAANHAETQVKQALVQDITGRLHDFDGITGVIGGPPCQGSSIINTKRNPDDPRNALMGEFMRLVAEIRPRFFTMENVPHVPAEIKSAVVRQATDAGYTVASHYLNAADYGAAQTRRRWILVGLVGRQWAPPATTTPRTVRDAFAGLTTQWGMMESKPETLAALARAVPDVWTPMNGGKFDNMIKLRMDRPSPAVVNLKKVYMVHPAECRNISLAEAAALQGFPANYAWRGSESEMAQMIANAMPSQLAGAVARTLTKT